MSKSQLIPGILNNALDIALWHIAIDDATLSQVSMVIYNGNPRSFLCNMAMKLVMRVDSSAEAGMTGVAVVMFALLFCMPGRYALTF